MPTVVGWVATAAAVGVRGASAPAATCAAILAVAATLVAAAASRRSRSRVADQHRRDAPVRGLGRRYPAVRPASGLVRTAAAVAVTAGVTALLLGAAGVREPERHPAALEEAAQADGMIVVDVVLDEPPAPIASRSAGGPGARGGRVRLVGRVTTVHVGRRERGRPGETAIVLPVPVPVVAFATEPDATEPSATEPDATEPPATEPDVAGTEGGGARPGLGVDVGLGVGAVIRVVASVRAADTGDRAAYLLQERGAPEPSSRARGPVAFADDLRSGLARAAAGLSGPGAQLLPGLAIGDVSAVGPDLAEEMRNSSLTHLTAVSGANCAVIVGLVLALAAAVGFRRPMRAVAALAALGAFVILVTPQPSVRRAAVMAAVLIVSTASGRPARGLPALAVAVVVLVAGDPWLARDVGFALSVLATAGLLVLAPPLAGRLARRMPRGLADALAIPIAAQVACQPVLLALQPGLPVHGVLANLLAEPAAAPATVGGLVACVLLPVWPAAGDLALRLAWLPASWIAAVAAVLSRMPWARVPWPAGPAGVVALAVATVLVVTVAALGRPPAIGPPWTIPDSALPRAGPDPAPGDVPPDG